jgi:hypothetical protein
VPDDQQRREQLRRKFQARHEAENTVRRQSGGKDRDELRTLLNAELDGRQISERPSTVETLLDRIEASQTPFGRTSSFMGVPKAMGEYAIGIYKLFRDPDSLSQPDWLKPPPRASYRLLPKNLQEWMSADLESDAGGWLGRVVDGVAVVQEDIAIVDIWLAWDAEPPTPASHLTVNIGSERVGTINDSKIPLFRPVMDAATGRDQLPVITASLLRRPKPPPYILEFTTPPWVSFGGTG